MTSTSPVFFSVQEDLVFNAAAMLSATFFAALPSLSAVRAACSCVARRVARVGRSCGVSWHPLRS